MHYKCLRVRFLRVLPSKEMLPRERAALLELHSLHVLLFFFSLIISQDEHTVPNMHPDSEDFVVLELMAQCEQKLESLQKELEGKDVAAIMKEMEEKEVRQKPTNSKLEMDPLSLKQHVWHLQSQSRFLFKFVHGLPIKRKAVKHVCVDDH